MSLPGGWEIVLVIIVIAVLFGGPKAIDSLKNTGKSLYKAKKEIDDIKDITKKL
ncbi:MAG: hypothetical protein GY754_33495 [bacterium]|nr:hypothetical protein [bacterium]